MRAPLRVYLDTSDFNHLYKRDISNELSEVREYLMKMVDLGEIEIGYSYPLIFELFRSYDQKHRSDRLDKAIFLKRLCQGKAHPHVADLDRGFAFPNDGIWVPRQALSAFSSEAITSQLYTSLHRAIDSRTELNRKQRRAFKTRSGFSDILRSLNVQSLKKEDFEGIPVSQSFLDSQYIEKLLKGEISGSFFSRKITEWAVDPEIFVQIWYEYSENSNPLESFVSEQFKKLTQAMDKARQSYEKAKDLEKSMKAMRRDIYASMKRFEANNGFGAPSLKLPKPKSLHDISGLDFTGDHGERWKIFNTYFANVISGKHIPQSSDVVDLIHLIYLPDVHLMRCDRRMSALMSSSNWFDTSKIVPTLRDLPSRIDALRETYKISEREGKKV